MRQKTTTELQFTNWKSEKQKSYQLLASFLLLTLMIIITISIKNNIDDETFNGGMLTYLQ